MRKTFETCTPEQAGIRSEVIEQLLDALEKCETEPHGLMILRHGRLCFSGWWKPYAPDRIHGLQSMTKTFSGTAVGMLITEGKLSLDTKIADIFPEKVPEDASAYLLEMTVRDVLCMGTGMETAAPASGRWLEDFFHTPVVHKPGTAFFYNNPGSNLLAAIVRKISGQPMLLYLEEQLFPYIGVDKSTLTCLTLPDGTEIGGGGIFTRLENCIRLMLLYMNGGVAGGKRLLSQEWIELATSCQNSAPNAAGIKDCQQGYGFQMWQCSYPGAYRADGALGQYVVCFPDLDLVIGIFETASYPTGVQQVLETFYNIIPQIADDALPDDPVAFRRLEERANALQIPAPFDGSAAKDMAAELSEGCYRITDGRILWVPEITWLVTGKTLPEIEGIVLQKKEEWRLMLNTNRGDFTFPLPTDGTVAEIALPGLFPYDLAYVQAQVCAPNELRADIRYIQTCYHVQLSLRMEGETLCIETKMNDMQPVHEKAVAVSCEKEGERNGTAT